MATGEIAQRLEVECASEPRALWPLLADTERFNRAVGLSRIRVKPLSGAGAARFLISTTLGGFAVEYEERPFEFVENERFEFRRVLRRGPVREIAMGFALEPKNPGTRVTVSIRVVPRLSLLRPVAAFNARRTLARFAREVERIDRELQSGGGSDRAAVTPPEPTAFGRAAQALRASVRPERLALAEKLIAHVRSGGDVAVAHLRPFELADQWSAPRREVLVLCLQAVVAGLLELSWDLICPSCRTSADSKHSLGELAEAGHCQLCDLSFGLELDKAVEATFRPPVAVRAVDEGPYCIGGPFRTPHVVSQAVLPARGEITLHAPNEHGRLRLFVRGGATASVEVRPDGPESASARAGEHIEPAALQLRPGGTLQLASLLAEETHAKLERSEWVNRAATAAVVSALPDFRRLFSGEVLRPGLSLKVGRVALLFSDLAASTQLYSRAGDAAAFRLVRDSFDVLRAAVEENGGALVKTIGDAIMAAFLDDEAAVRAAVAMLHAFPPFVANYDYAAGVALKLGVYSGPCFAVTANGVLDYFGQTVNVAARLQGQADSGELVLAESLADTAQAAGWLAGTRIAERYSAKLKGVEGEVRAARIVAAQPDRRGATSGAPVAGSTTTSTAVS